MAESQRLRELERLLQEAEARTERERQRADDAETARRDAETAHRDAETARRDAETALRDAEEQTRPTTLDEYLTACHVSLFSNFTIEPRKSLRSKGPITNPSRKWCPTALQPWSDFFDGQRRVFGLLYDTFPTHTRAFGSRHALAYLGDRLASRTIADEKGLELFLHNSVEDPVRAIAAQLKRVDDVKRAFRLGNGVVFENHPHVISDVSDEVVEGDLAAAPPSTPGHGLDLNKLRPDQICIYRSDEAGSARRTMLYVSEYKPPHKLTAPHLRIGLRQALDIYTDVVNRKTIPTKDADADERFEYYAERLTASAVTQTYHYMIEGGLEYGLLTTGEIVVFLKIDWREPGTLLYHLAEPSAEVAAHPLHSHLCTAVGQYLAFTLMTLGSSLHGQEERQRAKANLKTWLQDFETTVRSVPEELRRAPDSSPGFPPLDYAGIDRSPYLLRWKRREPTPDPARDQVNRDPRDPSDDDEAPDYPDTPSPVERRPRGGQGTQGTRRSQRILARRPRAGDGQGSHDQESHDPASHGQESHDPASHGQESHDPASHGQESHDPASHGQEGHDPEYCTQKCLLGLVRGRLVDTACPNAALHTGQARHDGKRLARARHALDHAQFLDLLWKQLKQSLDDGITPLPEGGARGVLFKVTLLAYGYTFVAKGTVRAFVKHLEHEAAVYERLQPYQGVHVPVFLGAIDLRSMDKIYYFDFRVYVIHMTFLSWAGNGIRTADLVNEADGQLEKKALRSLRAVHRAGVVHRDVRAANMLLNAETNGVMMIDFERASILEPLRRPLAPVVPSKRNQAPGPAGSSKPAEKSGKRRQVNSEFSQELAALSWLCAGGGYYEY